MSSRLDRITLSLSSPTFFAFTFSFPLPSFNCQMRQWRRGDLCAPRLCQCVWQGG